MRALRRDSPYSEIFRFFKNKLFCLQEVNLLVLIASIFDSASDLKRHKSDELCYFVLCSYRIRKLRVLSFSAESRKKKGSAVEDI